MPLKNIANTVPHSAFICGQDPLTQLGCGSTLIYHWSLLKRKDWGIKNETYLKIDQ